jgi:adenylate cyclase
MIADRTAWGGVLELVLGEGPKGTPPERVRWLIVEEQVHSEVLIGWVQLSLALFFLVLYTVSAKTSAGTQFLPVPWVLAAFLGFTLLRLVAAHRRWLNPPLLAIGVCVDMALLMGLIWSFHLQYEQPAPFYLKAPTLLYVFIFIALRALCFEPLYVIAAGLAAAAGWLLLLGYAAASGDMVVTRDYVHYMTSNSVLVGAEIDKVISILMVTAVLALALVRARRILFRAVLDGVLAKDLSRFVAPEVADRISTSDRGLQPGDGEVREATVLFTDIEGFSTLSERVSPEKLMLLLNEYFDAVSAAVDASGGVITQFQGDAMLVTFNAVKPDPGHAASAMRCAQAIRRATQDRLFGGTARMRTRCGINTGRIVTGAVGARNRLLYTVHGDEVNVAARLEQLNKKFGTYILATENTVRAAGAAFAFRRVDKVVVRGRASPTEVFTLTAGRSVHA